MSTKRKKRNLFLICIALTAMMTGCSPKQESPPAESPAAVHSEEERSRSFLEDSDMVRQKCESVFIVEALDEDGKKIAVGSGFLMFEEDILVTSAHVVTNAKALRVQRADGEIVLSLESVAVDEESDTAVYRLEKKAGTPLIPATETVKAEPVFAIGSSGGIMNLVTNGILSGYNETESVRWIAFSAPVSPGESGGALLNAGGEVIGIIVGSVKDSNCLNLASPIDCAIRLYEKGK